MIPRQCSVSAVSECHEHYNNKWYAHLSTPTRMGTSNAFLRFRDPPGLGQLEVLRGHRTTRRHDGRSAFRFAGEVQY